MIYGFCQEEEEEKNESMLEEKNKTPECEMSLSYFPVCVSQLYITSLFVKPPLHSIGSTPQLFHCLSVQRGSVLTSLYDPFV